MYNCILYNKQLRRKLRGKKKNDSGLTEAQDPTRFQNLNPVLSDTNEGMDGICSNLVDTSLSDFFRQEEENKEVGLFFLSTFYQP